MSKIPLRNYVALELLRIYSTFNDGILLNSFLQLQF